MHSMAMTWHDISAKQIEREFGVRYKTTWRMCKQIRELMAEDDGPASGKVQIDETNSCGRMRTPQGERPRRTNTGRRTGVLLPSGGLTTNSPSLALSSAEVGCTDGRSGIDRESRSSL